MTALAEGPSPHVRRGGELRIAGEALAGLMRAVLEKGRPFRFVAGGTSMHPFIQDGDVVTVVPFQGRGPKPGDVAAFVHPGTGWVRIHRVVGAEAGRFFLKGDNVLGDDGALDRESLLGLVAGLERGGRKIPVGPSLGAPVLARLSRTSWFTRWFRRALRICGGRKGEA